MFGDVMSVLEKWGDLEVRIIIQNWHYMEITFFVFKCGEKMIPKRGEFLL